MDFNATSRTASTNRQLQLILFLLSRFLDLFCCFIFVLLGQGFQDSGGNIWDASLVLPPDWDRLPWENEPQFQCGVDWQHSGDPYYRADVVADVSGLYGPGTYGSWLLIMTSAITTSLLLDPGQNFAVYVDSDILTGMIYSIVCCGDMLHRAFTSHWNTRCASYIAAARVAWCAWIFSIAAVSPNRDQMSKGKNIRHGLWCLLLVITSTSLAFTMYTNFTTLYNFYHKWHSPGSVPDHLKRMARNFFIYTMPMFIYYQCSSKIPLKWAKLLFGAIFVVVYTFAPILGEYHWLFRYTIQRDAYKWSPKTLLPITEIALHELDQVVAMITTVIILVWQWRVWKLGPKLFRLAKAVRNGRRRWDSSSSEESAIDLEVFPHPIESAAGA